MKKVILGISVFALIMVNISVLALPFSLGEPPGDSSEEKTGRDTEIGNVSSVIEDAQLHTEEDIDLSQPLTLEQCIDIAEKRSAGMRTAKLNLIQGDMNVKDAVSQYLPQITTDGRYQFTDDIDFGWERENYNASIAAQYVIWDHGRREGTLAQARLGQEAEYKRFDRTGQSLTYSIITAYYDLLKAEKLIDVDRQLLEQSKQNVEKVTAFVELDIAIEADISTARVQQATDELAVINDMHNVELAKANLAVLMGLPPNAPINVVDSPDYEKYMQAGIGEVADIQIEDAVAQAFAKRPELAEMRANQDALEWGLTLARLDLWPKITADCGYNVALSDYLRQRDALKSHKSWNVSARVSYPIFDGGRTRRTVQRADIAMGKLNESAAELERNVALDVHQAYLNLEWSRKSLDIARVQVEDARISLDVAQARYDLQMIILLELLDAQSRYAGAVTNQVKAFYSYKVAEGTLDRAMGVLQ